MVDAVDIEDRIDGSFGAGPAAPSLEGLLADGHRALRRRRAAAAGAGLAAALVIGGLAWSVNGDAGPGAESGYVDEPTSQTPEPDPWTYVPASDPDVEGNELVGWDSDGTLKVREGVEVMDFVADPLDVQEPDDSAAMAVSVDGTETWLVTQFNVDAEGTISSGTSSEEARISFPTFRLWLDEQMAMQRGEPTLALVRFGADGALEPLDDVTMIRQQADPDVGPTFADPGDTTAVAEVRWQGERWYVLARRSGNGGPEYFPTAASVSSPSLEGFLDYARDAYASGGGLR
jgi:hypothetical protein